MDNTDLVSLWALIIMGLIILCFSVILIKLIRFNNALSKARKSRLIERSKS